MSSGQPSSCLFPLTLRWISSSVSSRVGRGPLTSTAASWAPWSSVEPKLFGKVLLRGRVWGPSSLSARCLVSVERGNTAMRKEKQWLNRKRREGEKNLQKWQTTWFTGRSDTQESDTQLWEFKPATTWGGCLDKRRTLNKTTTLHIVKTQTQQAKIFSWTFFNAAWV